MVAIKLLHEVIGGLTKDMAVVSVTISGAVSPAWR
ncbi:hypothetical protein ACVIOG_007553 [Rhizobium leguminosarum]